jgi:hypothetical protein
MFTGNTKKNHEADASSDSVRLREIKKTEAIGLWGWKDPR